MYAQLFNADNLLTCFVEAVNEFRVKYNRAVIELPPEWIKTYHASAGSRNPCSCTASACYSTVLGELLRVFFTEDLRRVHDISETRRPFDLYKDCHNAIVSIKICERTLHSYGYSGVGTNWETPAKNKFIDDLQALFPQRGFGLTDFK